MNRQPRKRFVASSRAPERLSSRAKRPTTTAVAAGKKAFTLIELLVVIAIIALVGAVVISINGDPPQTLSSAQNAANTIFRAARLRSQSPNPERGTNPEPRYNIRSRVIILNDTNRPDEHLRLMRVLIGGTKDPTQTKKTDYLWYSTDIEYILPKGIFMVDRNARVAGGREDFTQETRSENTTRDGEPEAKMRKDYRTSTKSQKEGDGDCEWYYYEFDSDGTSNMDGATFIVSQGNFAPNSDSVLFQNAHNISGLYLAPSGETILYNDGFEIGKPQEQ